MQQTKLEMLQKIGTKYANRVPLGLDSSFQVVIKEVRVWSQICFICNIERQVTTNCLHHGCYSNH